MSVARLVVIALALATPLVLVGASAPSSPHPAGAPAAQANGGGSISARESARPARPAAARFAQSPPTHPGRIWAGARGLYRAPDGQAAAQERRWRAGRPAAARLIGRIARQPTAIWPAGDPAAVRRTVAGNVAAAARRGEVPVVVAYNIPQRDCAAAGARTAGEYRAWIGALAAGIGDRPAAVILEPDALPQLDCLATGRRAERLALLRAAAAILTRGRATAVYLDAGHSRWLPAAEAARRLRLAGVGRAAGFSLNVANFRPTPEVAAYGSLIARRLGGARFVIDTGRNGAPAGDPADWCNPPGRALGTPPTTQTGQPGADAHLWIKPPGESDGTCNGGPPAGQWWPQYALGLAGRAP